jgi:1-acyl-sn-glycerol-3-phosphate acyltransferase
VFFHLVIVRLVRRYARPLRIRGIENLERVAGPVIFAAHHESHSDTAIVLAALPQRFRERLIIAAAADVLFTNPVSGALASLFLGAVPIERKASALSTLREVADVMAEGNSLLIYPLGRCSADGSVGEFKPGVGLLARLSNTPVVLVGIEGSRHILPLTKRWPLRAAVTIRFAAPITYAHASAEAFAEDLQLEMARLQTSGLIDPTRET